LKHHIILIGDKPMAKIKNAEIVESVLGRWHPGDLVFIEFLEYSTESNSSTLKLTALFQSRNKAQGCWPSNQTEFYRVFLLFKGVRNFFVAEFGSGPSSLVPQFPPFVVSPNRCYNGASTS